MVRPSVTSHGTRKLRAEAWQFPCSTLAANGERRDENKPESDVLTAYLHLIKLQSQREFFSTLGFFKMHIPDNRCCYVLAYPVGDYLHLRLCVLTQVSFQIYNSGSLGSKRMCEKIKKEKLFYFQLINLHVSK